VRSDIDPELPLRSSPGRPLTDPPFELPLDEFEAVLRMVLFVCTLPTSIGVVGRDRKAAAAAAPAREEDDAWDLRNAWAAAVAADADGLTPLLMLYACIRVTVSN